MTIKTTASPPPAIRREVLAAFAGALCIPTIATVPMREPSPNPIDAIRHQADLLAAMVAEARGGKWQVLIVELVEVGGAS